MDRYTSAIRSSNLKVDDRTVYADTDVLGAMGIADRDLTRGKNWNGEPVHPAPLAVALARLFSGDNGASSTIVDILSAKAWESAKAAGIKLKRIEATDLARACLAWHRDGRCKSCGGHGTLLIPGSRTLGSQACKPCAGTGKVPFHKNFRPQLRGIADWLVDEMDHDSRRAGPYAMKKIADDMGL